MDSKPAHFDEKSFPGKPTVQGKADEVGLSLYGFQHGLRDGRGEATVAKPLLQGCAECCKNSKFSASTPCLRLHGLKQIPGVEAIVSECIR